MTKNHNFAIALFVAATLFVALLLSGCGVSGGPDLTPIGNGLALIGLGIVLGAFVLVLGNQHSKPPIRENSDEKPQ